MNMIILENDILKVCIAEKGAELQSLVNKQTGKEYMWSGNPDFWGKFSPVLFPIVGGLKDNRYTVGCSEYSLPRHGFARDQVFQLREEGDLYATLTLGHSDETLKVYPFAFRLNIKYTLDGAAVVCSYEVVNPGDEQLWFSIGAHPAFAIDTSVADFSNYYLEFNRDNELVRHLLRKDLISEETEIIPLDNKTLQLSHELFQEDALVMKSLKSDRIRLGNVKNENGIDFRFEDFPFFGIWSAPNADFVCLEPWCGIADEVSHNQRLEEKTGIMSLAAGTTWQRSWSVTTF
ncbi:aldose 1-epimerase family protein [Pedobacter deserti]|uniref:aldose 1-epimerase family protein n=1 Tax=Pedobacter deserti TaxID=2817382 RepID=UPI002108715F|nr:aldose 1-epimerase family protein [Pedobacter sp. SYSU D00382]